MTGGVRCHLCRGAGGAGARRSAIRDGRPGRQANEQAEATGGSAARHGVTLVLDSGALIALERNDRAMWRRMKMTQLAGEVPVSHGGVVGQAWRGRGPRQALLAKALAGIDVRPLDDALGRAAGELLTLAGQRDVIDAAVVLLADDGDHVITADPEDLEQLAAASERHVELIRA